MCLKIMGKHWPILQTNKPIQKAFRTTPIASFETTKNLRDIIGENTMVNDKAKKQQTNRRTGTCSPFYSRKNTMCCKQVIDNSSFTSHKKQEILYDLK